MAVEEDSKRCPHCAETIKAEAKVCRYCGRDVMTTTAPQRAVRSFVPPSEPQAVKDLNRYFVMLGWVVLGALALWAYRSCGGG